MLRPFIILKELNIVSRGCHDERVASPGAANEPALSRIKI